MGYVWVAVWVSVFLQFLSILRVRSILGNHRHHLGGNLGLKHYNIWKFSSYFQPNPYHPMLPYSAKFSWRRTAWPVELARSLGYKKVQYIIPAHTTFTKSAEFLATTAKFYPWLTHFLPSYSQIWLILTETKVTLLFALKKKSLFLL